MYQKRNNVIIHVKIVTDLEKIIVLSVGKNLEELLKKIIIDLYQIKMNVFVLLKLDIL